MTYAELALQVRRLPLTQRLAMLNVIVQSVREELDPPARLRAAVLELRGVGKSNGPASTDEEVATMYADYLLEKHS